MKVESCAYIKDLTRGPSVTGGELRGRKCVGE